MTAEQRYTLTEARRELNRWECSGRGHDIDVIYNGISVDPVRLVCGRCGDSWAVQPKETT